MYVLWCSCVGIWKWADLAFTCNQIRFDAAVFLSTSLGISSHHSIVSIGYSFVIFDFEFDPRFQSLVFSNNVILVCVWQNLFLWILPVFPTFFLLPSNIYVICWMRSSMVLPLFGKKKKISISSPEIWHFKSLTWCRFLIVLVDLVGWLDREGREWGYGILSLF